MIFNVGVVLNGAFEFKFSPKCNTPYCFTLVFCILFLNMLSESSEYMKFTDDLMNSMVADFLKNSLAIFSTLICFVHNYWNKIRLSRNARAK